jgi:4-hydroxysphinganine ceramide fatty acyl 2-hydroxylase
VFNNLKSSNEALNIIWKIGFLIGYMCYDLTHYALHHVDTTKSKGSYFHKLQRYHNQHHFGGEEAGYGVSSKFWDIVFRTEFKNKLSTDEHAKTA